LRSGENKDKLNKMPVISMNLEKSLKALAQERLIAIVRTRTAEDAFWAASLALECGFRLVEIPWTVPDAASVIARLQEAHPQAIIGAGTVLTLDQARDSLAAGASFLVSPVLDETLIRFGAERDVLTLPGTMTPTEIQRAIGWGAAAVKFFPAESAGGADFVQAVRGPFPDINIVATGGIRLEHVAGYLNAGCLAVGVGGPMLPGTLIQQRDEAALRQKIGAYLAIPRH
jgi:2-dehydro-3-deoxyphosphogluconate aldolase/(4S)-4-hydroxy-2-oxoglutarate aldolase